MNEPVKVVDIDAHEGPVYVAAEDALYVTTVPVRSNGVPRVAIKRIALAGARFPVAADAVSVVRDPANVANGMALDHAGRLLVCEQGTTSSAARISRVDPHSGDAETVADAWDGRPLNSPNDVVVKRDGTIWFTDPSYGHLQGFRPPPAVADHVYRHDPATGRTELAADGFDKPNGLAFSPDERVLYVADNGAPHHLLAFDVDAGGRLGGRRVLAPFPPEHPDGVKVDARGRIYASTPAGVRVLDPAGATVGEIDLPGAVNFTFGGAHGDVLFITADTAVWAVAIPV